MLMQEKLMRLEIDRFGWVVLVFFWLDVGCWCWMFCLEILRQAQDDRLLAMLEITGVGESLLLGMTPTMVCATIAAVRLLGRRSCFKN